MSFEKEIVFRGVELLISGSYQPWEPQTLEYPGCAEEVIVESVLINGEEFFDLFTDDAIRAIEAVALESE